jgi:hypothetical protein
MSMMLTPRHRDFSGQEIEEKFMTIKQRVKYVITWELQGSGQHYKYADKFDTLSAAERHKKTLKARHGDRVIRIWIGPESEVEGQPLAWGCG